MTLIIGLTGSIATGKSTVARLFKQANIPIVDADLISRDIMQVDDVAYRAVVAHFGKHILADDQTIDRKKLAELIFNDEEKRKQLNKIVHPIIIDQIIDQRDRLITEEERLIVLDIPLLFELNLTHLVDKIVVAYTAYPQQLERLKNRDQLTGTAAKKRIESQISIEEKRKKADYVIDNNQTIAQTEAQIKELLTKLTS